jgi:hypothetical protein
VLLAMQFLTRKVSDASLSFYFRFRVVGAIFKSRPPALQLAMRTRSARDRSRKGTFANYRQENQLSPSAAS